MIYHRTIWPSHQTFSLSRPSAPTRRDSKLYQSEEFARTRASYTAAWTYDASRGDANVDEKVVVKRMLSEDSELKSLSTGGNVGNKGTTDDTRLATRRIHCVYRIFTYSCS
jgi:hypothetical protein